ncbi:MAG: ABC transporter permease subunit [Bacteroidetes bacterium]|nr:ABC transporter permease subunit [Bacteroidota bacterium]
MKFSKIRTIYAKEIRDTFRDKSTLLTVFILPLLIYPLLFLISGFIVDRMEKEERMLVPPVAVSGPAESDPFIISLMKNQEVHYEKTAIPCEDLAKGRILALIDAPRNMTSQISAEKTVPVTVLYDQANRLSVRAKTVLVQILEGYQHRIVVERLTHRSLDSALIKPFSIESKSITSKQKMGGFIIGVLVPYLLIVLLFTAAMNTATDITAGEKERKTMETLLASNSTRQEIVIGKVATIITVGLLSATMGLAGLAITFAAGLSMLSAAAGIAITIAPLPILFSFLMLIPVSCLFGALLLMIGSQARSVKESNSYGSYTMLIIVLLAMVSVVNRGAEPSTGILLTPVMSTTLVQQELLMGIINWSHIGITIATTALLALVAFFFAVASFSSERVLFRQ